MSFLQFKLYFVKYSIRHFSTIGTEHADFCLSRKGAGFCSPLFMWGFLDEINTAVNHNGK